MKTNKTFSRAETSTGRSTHPVTHFKKSVWIVLLILFGQSALLHSQMNNWVLPPFKFGVTTSPASTGPLYSNAPSSGAYNVSNGAYDQNNGGLLFYVEDYSIKNPSGVTVGYLGTTGGYQWGGEIVILPFPGMCKRFYVIYSSDSDVLYTIVDCYGSTVQVDRGNGFGNNGQGYLIGNMPNYGTGFAASKRSTNISYSGFVYYLYMVNSGTVYYSIVGGTNNGITAPTQIYQSSSIYAHTVYYQGPPNYSITYPCISTEVELSWNGQYLAFNGVDARCGQPGVYQIQNSGNVEIIQLPTPTSASYYSMYSSGDTKIFGLELVGSNTPDLYVLGEQYYVGPGPNTVGIFQKFDIVNSVATDLSTQVVTGAPDYQWQWEAKWSQLEYARSGKLCYISNFSNNRYFVEYDVISQNYSATQIDVAALDVDPDGTPGSLYCVFDYIYTLPDQIDGENYNAFTTTPYTYLTSMKLNTLDLISNDVSFCKFNEVYNCNPISLAAYLNYEAPITCGSSIDIHEVDANCNPLYGNNIMNCDDCGGEFLATDNPWVKDLRKYVDVRGISLGTHTGYFLVTWNVTDCCGNRSSRTAHVRVLGTLVNTNLEIYDKTNANPQNPWLPAATLPGSPVNAGSSSVQFQVANSTGNITGYTTLIEEVDNAGNVTGAGTIYNQTKSATNITGIGVQNLNSLCINTNVWPTAPTFGQCPPASPTGYTGYWSYTNAQYSYQKEYRITVTLFNPCSSSSKSSYVYIGSIGNRMADITGIEEQKEVSGPVLYPNPASSELFISTPPNSDGAFTVELTDVIGRKVLQHTGQSGKQAQSIDISQLPIGVYMWKYQSEGKTSIGKVQVMR